MSPRVAEISKRAMSLSPYERIELIENLFFSLEASDEQERIDKLWAQEAEDRLTAYEAGKIDTIPASEVFNKLNRSKI